MLVEVVVGLSPQKGHPPVVEYQREGAGCQLLPNPWVVPGKQSSGHKHNPFSALAAAAKQSVKAAKRKKLDFDDGDEGKKARRSSELIEKAPHKQLPCKLLKKKSGSKNKAFTEAIKKPHKFHLGTVAL